MEFFDLTTVTKMNGAFYFKATDMTRRKTYHQSPLGNNSHKLIYRLNGNATMKLGKKFLTHNKDSILFLPKDLTDDKYICIVEGEDEVLELYFNSDIPLFNEATVINSRHYTELRNLFFEINILWFNKTDTYYHKSLSILYKILSVLYFSLENKHNNIHYNKIEPAINYINDHFCEQYINIEDLAQMCGISYSYFRRLFLQTVGVSPTRYITIKKIDYAQQLLASQSLPVKKVATMVGFLDIYHFSKTFKNLTGFSPSSFINPKKQKGNKNENNK